MNEIPASQLRISDKDRESAITALGEHLSDGRITLDEYGDRSAQITAVRTRGELTELFADLPLPHPSFSTAEVSVAPATQPTSSSTSIAAADEGSWRDKPLAQRMYAAAVPLSGIVAAILFFSLGHIWLWFLLPAAVTAIGTSLWGYDWHQDRGRNRNRDRDRDQRRIQDLEDRRDRRDRRHGRTDRDLDR